MKRFLSELLILFCVAVALVPSVRAENQFFAIERADSGVWWFRSPQGQQFLSLGVSDIPAGPTREKYDPANPGYASFRYYDSTGDWINGVRSNLQKWNFNTIGAWGHADLANTEFPETRVLHWGSSLLVPWCDIFSQEFADHIANFAQRDVAPFKDDKTLVGWFTDNELQWYGDTIFCFHLNNQQPSLTREKLIALLKEHYKNDFTALQKDFSVGQATTFDELGRRGGVHLMPAGQGLALINRFTQLVAERYYRVVHDAIRKHDPNHLILGDRYMSYCPAAVARAAGPYVDVISTNFDWPDWMTGKLPTHYLQMLHDESRKPVLITEWYVAAKENRSGNRNRGVSFTIVPTQDQRAVTAERRLGELLSLPYVVGAHWFRYADEPTNGRAADGEDFNFGLVDIHNEPYDKLVDGMRRANLDAYELHAQSANARESDSVSVTHHPAGSDFPANVEQFSPLKSIDPSPLADLRAAWDDDQLYLGLVGFRFVDPQLFAEGHIPASYRQRLSLKLGENRFDLTFDPDKKSTNQETQLSMLETRHRHLGVRFTYLIKVPVKNLSKDTSWQVGSEVPLEVTLYDPSGQATRWRSSLVLAEEADRLAEQITADPVPQ